MEARYETHLLIDELQREKMLETQAKQEQVLPVAVPAPNLMALRFQFLEKYIWFLSAVF